MRALRAVPDRRRRATRGAVAAWRRTAFPGDGAGHELRQRVRAAHRGRGQSAGQRAQRVPRAGAVFRWRDLRPRRDPAAVSPSTGHGRRPVDPARPDTDRCASTGRRGGPSQASAAGRWAASETRPAAVWTARRRQDAHRALPDLQPHRDHRDRADGPNAAPDRRSLLGGEGPGPGDARRRGRRPDRGGPGNAPRRAPDAVPAAQRDGRASRGRRRRVRADDEPRRPARAGVGRPTRSSRPGG